MLFSFNARKKQKKNTHNRHVFWAIDDKIFSIFRECFRGFLTQVEGFQHSCKATCSRLLGFAGFRPFLELQRNSVPFFEETAHNLNHFVEHIIGLT